MPENSASGSAYRAFQDLLTAYRTSRVLMSAHELGIFETLAHGRDSARGICLKTGMDIPYGSRFLNVLVHLGLLDTQAETFALSEFSKCFLVKQSAAYQGRTLEFEKALFDAWQSLAQTLRQGTRVYGVTEKSTEDYKASLSLYLGAMDNAARIRAVELWECVKVGHEGLIVDAGAGSGAFLAEFLGRHQGWRGVFCDLPDVVLLAMENPLLQAFGNRLAFQPANLLTEEEPAMACTQADIVLCSNLVHCQGKEETQGLFFRLAAVLAENGILIIHDFFTDASHGGALYDLHMMLNTYNGRTYSVSDLCAMLTPFGLTHHSVVNLASGSTALIFSRKEMGADRFVDVVR